MVLQVFARRDGGMPPLASPPPIINWARPRRRRAGAPQNGRWGCVRSHGRRPRRPSPSIELMPPLGGSPYRFRTTRSRRQTGCQLDTSDAIHRFDECRAGEPLSCEQGICRLTGAPDVSQPWSINVGRSITLRWDLTRSIFWRIGRSSSVKCSTAMLGNRTGRRTRRADRSEPHWCAAPQTHPPCHRMAPRQMFARPQGCQLMTRNWATDHCRTWDWATRMRKCARELPPNRRMPLVAPSAPQPCTIGFTRPRRHLLQGFVRSRGL